MRNLSLNFKMSSLFIFFALGAITIAIIGLANIRSMNESLTQVISTNVPRIDFAYKVQSNFRLAAYLHTRSLGIADQTIAANYTKQVDDLKEAINKDLAGGLSITSEVARPWWTTAQEKLSAWEKSVQSARNGVATQNDELISAATTDMATYRGQVEEQLKNIISFNEARMKDTSIAAADLYQGSINLLVTLSALLIIAISTIATFVLRSTSKSINEVIQNLTEGSLQVSTASQQIASASEELSQASTEQAASLEETAASVEEMNSMIGRNSENASAAENTSNNSQAVANNGQEVINKMLQSMEAINRSSEGMAETVAVIEQIDKETKVIHDIVNKTELLSFNASVEAARAGEHGKGFAVVAEEVGNLARMSGIAAEKIATLLEDSKRKVTQMVDETKVNVATGASVAQECGEVFKQVVYNVTEVSGMAKEISSASQEQARGVNEITKAMNQLDQMTQQNAATSEECASAAEELSAQSIALNNAVNNLVQTIHGAAKQPTMSMPTSAPVVQKSGTSNKVIHLKTGMKTASSTPVKFKKAAGAPDYNSNGFSDI